MSLSPQIVAGIHHGAPPLVTCSAVFAFFLSSVVAQVAVTLLDVRRPLERGTVLLGGGCLVVAAGVLVGSVPLLLAGAAVAGIGQGASFTRGLASVLEHVTARDR